jgi:predicted nucleic acid-binding protein
MTRRVFLDTSAWVAAANPRDRFHVPAARWYRSALAAGQVFLTTNLVLAETYVMLCRRIGDAVALDLLDRLRSDPSHEIVWSTPDLEREAVDRWLRPRLGQRISLVDAVSFEVMRREGIRTAFAFDGHFEAAGFERVPTRDR